VQNETLEAVATEAYERLNRAMQRLAETSA
jgi:hypothetical protein